MPDPGGNVESQTCLNADVCEFRTELTHFGAVRALYAFYPEAADHVVVAVQSGTFFTKMSSLSINLISCLKAAKELQGGTDSNWSKGARCQIRIGIDDRASPHIREGFDQLGALTLK
jgi:hypothetical protein